MSDPTTPPRCAASPAGDAAALQAVIDRFAGPVGRTLARLAPDGHAEDLLQETFVKVWRHAESFDGRSAASTWVFQIALNVARDAARKRTVRDRADRAAVKMNARPHAPAAGSLCEAGDARERVRRAVAALPAELREPLALRHFGGLTAAEGRGRARPAGRHRQRPLRPRPRRTQARPRPRRTGPPQ